MIAIKQVLVALCIFGQDLPHPEVDNFRLIANATRSPGETAPSLSPACAPHLPSRPGPSPCPSLVAAPHYLVLDANVVLDQIDVLEEAADGLDNVVVLQTVLEEVRHRSSPIYKRLKVRTIVYLRLQ